MSAFTKAEIVAYLRKHGCFCGGHGVYTDYNCGASFEVRCPHCKGTGTKKCKCLQPVLRCT
jgi:hypothetical protein